MESEPQARVGITVMVFKDGKVLLGKRKGSHGEGEYAGTGGHLEYMESIVECAKRETLEETGITIKNIQLLGVTEIMQYAPKHYVDIGLVAEWESGEPVIMEPNKIEGWDWYDVYNLPEPLFGSVLPYIESYKAEQIRFLS